MALISYTDKVTMNENASIPAINKCQASDMNEIKNITNNTISGIGTGSDTYNSASTYDAGDIVIKNNAVYECNTNNTTGTWDSSKWDIVPILVSQ